MAMTHGVGLGAIAGFQWNTGDNPHQIPDRDALCVRKALCLLMGWAPGSPEWNSIPPNVAGTDLKRLCEEFPDLGLKWHGLGDPDVPADEEGIVVGTVAGPGRAQVGHSEYSMEIGSVVGNFGGIMGVITRKIDRTLP